MLIEPPASRGFAVEELNKKNIDNMSMEEIEKKLAELKASESSSVLSPVERAQQGVDGYVGASVPLINSAASVECWCISSERHGTGCCECTWLWSSDCLCFVIRDCKGHGIMLENHHQVSARARLVRSRGTTADASREQGRRVW